MRDCSVTDDMVVHCFKSLSLKVKFRDVFLFVLIDLMYCLMIEVIESLSECCSHVS